MVSERKRSGGLVVVVVVALVSMAATPSSALAAPGDVAGRIVMLRGSILVAEAGKAGAAVDETGDPHGASHPVARGDYIRVGDVVVSGADSSARLLMRDKSVLDLAPHTRIKVADYTVTPERKRRSVKLHVWLGRLWARVTRSPDGQSSFQVSAVNAVAGVRGTVLAVDVNEAGQVSVTVVSGLVEMASTLSASVRLLGPRRRGTMSSGGEVRVSHLSQGEINKMQQSIESSARLSDKDADKRLQAAARDHRTRANKDDGAGAAAGTSAHEAAGDEKDQQGPAGEGDGSSDDQREPPGPPDIGILPDLDPSAGKTRVRGTVEVRP